MCRMIAYEGPPLTLGALVYDAPHALQSQAYRPRTMLSGTVNVDGTGIAWWPEGETTPLRYATERPPWSDDNLRGLAPRLAGVRIVAAVRSATPGMPGGEAAVAPFVLDDFAFAHNGYVDDFQGETGAALLALVPAAASALVEARTDSRVLFAIAAAHRLHAGTGARLAPSLVHAARATASLCRERGQRAQLVFVAADRQGLAAVRASVGVPANTLFFARDRIDGGSSLTIASEPLEDSVTWQPLPETHALEWRRGALLVEPFSLE